MNREEQLQRTRAERARRGSRRKRDLAALESERRAAAQAAAELEADGLPAGAEEAWEKARGVLLEEVHEDTFRLWFEPLRPIAERDGALFLAGPSRVVRWVERRYRELLVSALTRTTDLTRAELVATEEPR